MIRIRPARMSDVKGLNACIGSIAAERKFLAMVRRPSLKQSRAIVRMVLDARYPLVVAMDGTRMVGWCDVVPRDMEGFRHTAGLGMGLLPEYRGSGIGARLMRRVLELSRRRGIEKIELQVYASNRGAWRFYRRHGFKVEGRRVRARKLDGRYDDIVHMGRLLRGRRRR